MLNAVEEYSLCWKIPLTGNAFVLTSFIRIKLHRKYTDFPSFKMYAKDGLGYKQKLHEIASFFVLAGSQGSDKHPLVFWISLKNTSISTGSMVLHYFTGEICMGPLVICLTWSQTHFAQYCFQMVIPSLMLIHCKSISPVVCLAQSQAYFDQYGILTLLCLLMLLYWKVLGERFCIKGGLQCGCDLFGWLRRVENFLRN